MLGLAHSPLNEERRRAETQRREGTGFGEDQASTE